MFGLEKLFYRPPTQRQFAQLALGKLNEKLPQVAFEFSEEHFALRRASGGMLYLANFFADYGKLDRAGRAALLERVVAAAAEPEIPEDLEKARAHLLPVLRNLPGLECGMLDVGTAGHPAVSKLGLRQLSPQLGVEVAFDTPEAVCQVGAAHFRGWGITGEEALAIAIDNLRHKAPPSFHEVLPGTYIARYGDLYDAARILLPELAWQLTLNGNPVAMIPTREYLLITGDKDDPGKALMVAMAQTAFDETPRHLTGEIFRLEGSQWTVWQPDGVCAAQHRKLMLSRMSGQYQSQKAALTRALEQDGRDIYVAEYSAMEKPDGGVFSYASMTFGVRTLLPEADFIFMVDLGSGNSTDAKPMVIPWDAFRKILGSSLQRLHYVMPRYSVQFSPSADQLTAIRQQSVTQL